MLAGEGLAVVLSLAPGVNVDRLVYFGLTSMMVQWVSLLALGGLYVLRRLLAPLTLHQLAYVALALLVLNTWLVAGAAWYLLGDLWPMTDGSWQALFLRLTVIVLTVGLLGLAAFQNHWRGRLHAVRAKQSELQALQARIRPHFLFNTLNTGAALVHQRPEEAERLLLDLADLFRAALAGPRQILLEDELSLVRRYLEIESLRFGDRLRINWQQPRELPPVTYRRCRCSRLSKRDPPRHRTPARRWRCRSHRPHHRPIRWCCASATGAAQRPGRARPSGRLNASQVRSGPDRRAAAACRRTPGSRFIATVRLPLNTAG